MSTFTLSYHFGSREGVLGAIMTRVVDRHRDIVAGWLNPGADWTPGGIMLRCWRGWCLAEEFEPYHRLFYEVLGLSLHQPGRFDDHVGRGAALWLESGPGLTSAYSPDHPNRETAAWMIASSLGGDLLAVLVTREKAGPTAAVEQVAALIDEMLRAETTHRD